MTWLALRDLKARIAVAEVSRIVGHQLSFLFTGLDAEPDVSLGRGAQHRPGYIHREHFIDVRLGRKGNASA